MQPPDPSAKQCVPCTATKSWIEWVVVVPADAEIGASTPAVASATVATINQCGVLPLIVPLLTDPFRWSPRRPTAPAQTDYTRGPAAVLSDRQVSPRTLTGP